MRNFDVVVVGARLAGAATAMLLARSGMRVALVDRSRLGADTLSTHALLRPGVLQLHRWGLLDRVRAAGTPVVRRTVFTYADSVVPIDIDQSDGVDGLYASRRTVLDRILVDAASEAGVDVRFGHSVSGLLRSGRGRPVGVTGSGPDGQPFAIRAAFVVGADGIRSTIARLVDAPIEHQGQHASALTYGYWSDADVSDYEWVFVQQATAGAIPTNAGQTCVFASTTPERMERGGVEVIHSIVRASAPDLADRLLAGRAPTSTLTWHGQTGFLRRAWGNGWALVGDAGYFKDPLAAHGMTDALRDAELLARALAAVHAGTPATEALAEYQAQRDALSVPMLQVTDAIASHRWSDAEISGLLKHIAKFMRDEARLLNGLDLSQYSMQPSKGAPHDQHKQLEPHATRHAA
jgi:2-polyprenyl-6-methoxyphenol hydroxylase-like FAD-dependent oxidoreductase